MGEKNETELTPTPSAASSAEYSSLEIKPEQDEEEAGATTPPEARSCGCFGADRKDIAHRKVDGEEKEQEEDEAAEEGLPPVPVSKLFQFADFQDKCYIAFAFLAAVVSGANQPAQLIIFGNILDAFNSGSEQDVQEKINFLACLYVAVASQMLVTAFLQTACMTKAAGRQTKRLREAYLSALLRQDTTFFDTNDTGGLATSVMETTAIIGDGLGEKLALSVQFLSSFVFGLAVAMFYVWQLALLLVGAVPILVVVVGIAISFVQKSDKTAEDAYNAAGGTAQEVLGAIRTVASLCIEKKEVVRYKTQLAKMEQSGVARCFSMAGVGGLIAFIMWCMYALGLWFGSKLIADDMDRSDSCHYTEDANGDFIEPASHCISGGDVMICFFSVLFGGLNLGQASPGITAVTSACNAAAKVFQVIERDSQIDPSSDGGTTKDDVHGAIQLRDVRFAYPTRPDHQVYSGLNLDIQAGQTVALVGPSGCGKSTVVQLLERFYDPTHGAITLDGTDLRDLKVSWLRQQIGLVSQEPTLFSGSIFDNIANGKPGGAAEAEVLEAARMANVHEFVEKMADGYDTQVGEKGIQLSGGQKQRIAIARAIVRDPAILVLDEATSALDTKSERQVQAALDALLQTKRRTTLVIAHRLSTIRDADKIVVFMDGEVVQQGTHDELIQDTSGHYYGLAMHSATEKQSP